MIEVLELEENTFEDLDSLMEHVTLLEENTSRRMIRMQEMSLVENGVRIGTTTYQINKKAFQQLMKIASMDWGGSYFKNAPTDLIISDFERMKHLNPELQCRVVFREGKITAVLPQDLIVAPYDQVLNCLNLEDIEYGVVADEGLRITMTESREIEVDPKVNDIVKLGQDFSYSNSNWSKFARMSPYLLRLICTNGVTARDNSIFKSFTAYIPKNGDLSVFYEKLSDYETSLDIDRLVQSFDIMRENKLRDLESSERIVSNTRYWLTKEIFDQNPKLNLVLEDKVAPNYDILIYDFFNEITDMAKQVPMVRRKRVEEIAGNLADESLDIPLRQL